MDVDTLGPGMEPGPGGMIKAGICPEKGCGMRVLVIAKSGKIRRHSQRGQMSGTGWCPAGGKVHPRWTTDATQEPSALEDLDALIGQARVQFWQCLVPAHRDRKDTVTVEWDEAGVAHCTMWGCELTSAHTAAFARQVAEYVRSNDRRTSSESSIEARDEGTVER